MMLYSLVRSNRMMTAVMGARALPTRRPPALIAGPQVELRADLAVPSVVEPIDALGDGDLEVVDVAPRSLVPDQLRLEQRVERLG
jgi:hypothetical protein